METFEVKRGLIKTLSNDGGLAAVASKHFENVDGSDNTFSGSHGIMTSITGEYNSMGKLVVDVQQERPNFDDPSAMEVAMDSRKRWSSRRSAEAGVLSNGVNPRALRAPN